MTDFKVGDEVWYFVTEVCHGTIIFPGCLCLHQGIVVWVNPLEEIIHVYINGNTEIVVLLDIFEYAFKSKQEAIKVMEKRKTD